jgi:hypothetical protein
MQLPKHPQDAQTRCAQPSRFDVPQFDDVVKAVRNEQFLRSRYLARRSRPGRFFEATILCVILRSATEFEGEQLQALHLTHVTRNWRTHVRSVRSHMSTEQSSDAENNIFSGETFCCDGPWGTEDVAEPGSQSKTALTRSRWPRNVKHSRVRKIHTLTVVSMLPLARKVESKLRQITPSVWLSRVLIQSPVRQFQMRSV